MRLSEFWRLVSDEFGEAPGRHLTATLSLTHLGSRTADEALGAGEDPKVVWAEICRAKEIPEERHLGRDLPLRSDRWDG
jgi:hypothetical protein